MAMKKIVYIILDGLGDDPVEALGGKTPLEAARTPHLDGLAAAGLNGYVTTVGEGIAPESDIAVFAVLGYDPREYHSGRGPLESLGSGLEVADGDLAYRVNFATVGHRGVLVIRSDEGPLSAEVENSDPAYGREGSLGVAKESFDNRVVHVSPMAGPQCGSAARGGGGPPKQRCR